MKTRKMMTMILPVVLIIASLTGPASAGDQCAAELENLDASGMEYLGLRSSGQRIWVGQQFATDCDGKFLTVSFLVDVPESPSGGVRNLTAGDALTCTLMDDQNQPIASVVNVLTAASGLELVEFDFGSLDLGLAAGTLAAKVSIPHDAYGRVATSADQVPGQLMLGDEVDLNYKNNKDAAFRITWDPTEGIVGTESQSWSGLKASFR